MFSFFNKKPLLKELIPTGFVDIHSHILFGIDDGAKTSDDTKDLITSMKSLGFTKAITTPHTTPLVWENTREGILNRYDEVKKTLPDEAKSIQLEVASEYLMDETFLRQVREEPLLTLKDKYVLVEMSYMTPPIHLYDILFELRTQGYEIVLAHPERYNFYHADMSQYKKLKKAGCHFQLNLLSVTGYYGEYVLKAADALLKENMFDFVGSDIHHKRHIAGFDSKVKVKHIETLEACMAKNDFFL